VSTRQQQREQFRRQQPKSGPPAWLIVLFGLLALLICAVAAAFLIIPMLRGAQIDLPNLASATQTPAPTQPLPGGKFVMHVIDVGQGDSILLIGPGGSTMLIDGGEKNSGSLAYLKANGISRINKMVETHTDADHIGGLVDVLNALPVDEVIATGATANTKTYEQLLDGIAKSKAKYTEVHRGDKIALDGMSFLVLNPGVNDKIKDANDSSIVLRTEYGPTSFMLTGDAEKQAENRMLASGLPLQATILKVGHHGSSTSSSPAFLQAVQPKVAIYSAGLNNKYGHPSKTTITNLTKIGAQIYGAIDRGTVTVIADSQGYTSQTEK
jgi:beta-lactamase superfamily II metal-dependent hydrolase